MVHRNTYELKRNADGKFKLDVERKGNIRDEMAVYYVETPNGKCAFKVCFPVGEQATSEQENASNEVIEAALDEISSVPLHTSMPKEWVI